MAAPWVLRSVEAIEEARQLYGHYNRLVQVVGVFSATSPTATAGGPTMIVRPARNVIAPSMHADLAGMFLRTCRLCHNGQAQESWVAALEYELGSLNLATGTFTAGVSMPVKRFNDQPAIQTASQWTLLATTVALTATTPTITVTYTNQEGVGSRTAALVLPTNAALRGAYQLNQVLQAGDTGMQSVQNMTKSAGTVGTVKCFGYLMIAAQSQTESMEPGSTAKPEWLVETGDNIAFLQPTTRGSCALYAHLLGVGQKA